MPKSAAVARSSKLTFADYDRVFEEERQNKYPVIDALENRCGFAVGLTRLENAARTLACPVKVNPPNWQHGRVIYSVLRAHLENGDVPAFVNCVDIGTAKGFSALCAQWALDDANKKGRVTSIDVIDPNGRVPRNTIADLGKRLPTLPEILEPFTEARPIKFEHGTALNWLAFNRRPIEFVFVDGKHSPGVVEQEARAIRLLQVPGAIALFDDVQIPGVRDAVERACADHYTLEFIKPKEGREYALATAVG